MASTSIALADHGIVIGSRVGFTSTPYHELGTVVAISDQDNITVRWDDSTITVESWLVLAPNGYVVEGVEGGPTAAPATASAAQWASAVLHLEHRQDWRVVRIAGTRYIVMQSGRSGRVYQVRADARGCACPWYARTGRRCSHMLALETSEQSAQRRAA